MRKEHSLRYADGHITERVTQMLEITKRATKCRQKKAKFPQLFNDGINVHLCCRIVSYLDYINCVDGKNYKKNRKIVKKGKVSIACTNHHFISDICFYGNFNEIKHKDSEILVFKQKSA